MAFDSREGVTSGVCRDCSTMIDSTGSCNCAKNRAAAKPLSEKVEVLAKAMSKVPGKNRPHLRLIKGGKED